MKKVHKLIQDSWSEYPWESEYLLCDNWEKIADPECSINSNAVTCKKCLKIMAKENIHNGTTGKKEE